MPDPKDPEKINITPSLEEVTSAYSEVVVHNERYTGLGAAFRNIINGLVADGVLINEEELEAMIVEGDNEHTIVVEGDMDAELQEMFHGETFTRIGIKLYPIGGENIHSFTGKRAASTELEPTIVNTQLYLDFLRQQTKEAVNRQDKNFKLMVDVLNTLEKIIRISYTEGAKGFPGSDLLTQHGEDALRTFIAIDEQYQRLGLDKPTRYAEYLQTLQSGFHDEAWKNKHKAEEYYERYQELRECVHYWGKEVLPEYITFGSPEKMAKPKDWAADGAMDRLNAQVDSIASLVGPERTTEFGVESARAMLKGIETTLKTMGDNPDNWMNQMEGARSGFEQNAKRLKALLG